MAVSGVPNILDDHADRIIQLAIGMLKAAEKISPQFDQKLELRIGIATGPITAGVIGKTKFAYDVWSPTVNLAARLESMGAPGSITVSDATYKRLRNEYAFERAPNFKLKGIGSVRSWYLS